jgi:hypothetical protein
MASTDRLRSISPEHAAFAAGRATTDLGNWRSKRFLVGVGTKVGREHAYSLDDVLGHIAPLAFLARYGLGLARAHEVVRSHAAEVRAALHDGTRRDDLCVMLSLSVSAPDLEGAPEALLHVNFSAIARFALDRLKQCKPARPRRRRSPLVPSIAREFVAR